MAIAIPPPIKTLFKILVAEKEIIRRKNQNQKIEINLYPFVHVGHHQLERPSLSR